MQKDILLTGSASVENKKESSFQLHQKKMSEPQPFYKWKGADIIQLTQLPREHTQTHAVSYWS